MVAPKLINRIAYAQKRKGAALHELIKDFSPLLKKYASLLRYEDAEDDLRLDFIRLICTFKVEAFANRENPFVLAYIEKSIRNAFIRHSKINQQYRNRCVLLGDLNDKQKDLVEKLAVTYDRYSEIDTSQIKKQLTEREYSVIDFLYYRDRSVEETGRALGVSRQAVNQAKNKALGKLRKNWLS